MQVEVARSITGGALGDQSRCEGWSIREVLNHSIAVTTKFTEFASGRTDAPRTPRADLLGDDHLAAVVLAARDSRSAWSSVDESRRCVLPFGSFSASAAAGINLVDVLAHTWDIAAAISVELDEHDAVWASGLTAAVALIGNQRDPAHYAPEVATAPTASPMVRFLGFLGR